ncbi:MAG TPA: YlmC/YmxH family sporulation protein [Clostridia bacterium]|nr:YlmC/YmxH family sporulation protein [Clostridia bacterium]
MANTCFGELRRKEVVNVRDGARLGCICDLEIELGTGVVCAIIVPGPPRFWGLLKSSEELVIPFNKISKIGDDVILVDIFL